MNFCLSAGFFIFLRRNRYQKIDDVDDIAGGWLFLILCLSLNYDANNSRNPIHFLYYENNRSSFYNDSILELYILDLCVNMAECLSKWHFNRSVWKIFHTCEEKYFSSHVMDFSVKKNFKVLTKRSQQVRNNKEN